jgi:hypothetical protein
MEQYEKGVDLLQLSVYDLFDSNGNSFQKPPDGLNPTLEKCSRSRK